jgi:AcrR family transcriptional regulator
VILAATLTHVTRKERAVSTRRRIVDAAWTVVAEVGLTGLTTRLVAREAGISHGMCHYHFEGKSDLMLALVERARGTWVTPLGELVAGPGTAIERLDRIVRWMAEPAAAEVLRVHLELSAFSERDERLPGSSRASTNAGARPPPTCSRSSATRGALREGVDPRAVGRAFAVASDALVWQQSLSPSLASEQIMRAMVDPLLAEGAAWPA